MTSEEHLKNLEKVQEKTAALTVILKAYFSLSCGKSFFNGSYWMPDTSYWTYAFE